MPRMYRKPTASTPGTRKQVHPLVAIGVIVAVLIIAAICVSIPYRSAAQAGRESVQRSDEAATAVYDAESGRR